MRAITTIRLALAATTLVAIPSPLLLTARPASGQTAPLPQIRRIYGVLVSVDLTALTVGFQKRNGKTILVDISQAVSLDQLGVLPLTRPVVLWGVRGPDRLFHVQAIGHCAPSQRDWGNDDDSGE